MFLKLSINLYFFIVCRYFMDIRITELVDPNDPLGYLKRRGWANIPDAPLNPDDRIPILFDATGNPIGENGQQLKSSIGRLAKSSIPININDWSEVDDVEKFKIWITICVSLLYFIINICIILGVYYI